VAPLTAAQVALLREARRAVLATVAPNGSPRLVPITFAFDEYVDALVLYSALDEKPKSVADPRELARVRDILERPRVSVLVDRWSEDWSTLGWLRLHGSARLLNPDDQDAAEHARAVGLLRARYPQYADHALGRRPMIRIEIERATGWAAT
jgi:PPOX class probable F420-dependent enzyme